MLSTVEVLKQLVAIPSVNPMGREVSENDQQHFEFRIAQHLQTLFQQMQVPWQVQEVAPLRNNIVARFDGDIPLAAGGRLIVLEAHQDTVPVDGMVIDPFDPVVADGKVYGRGSCDIKGGLAAMLCAFARLVETRPAQRPTVILASTINEEHGFSGAKSLCQLWQQPGADSLFPQPPDAIVVAEPTLLDIVVAHKGAMRWKFSTSGRASHSSKPEAGDNAIYKMARLISTLERYHLEVLSTRPAHPLCGGPTLSVGVIEGGISVNTVPDACTIEIDRRLIPGEDAQASFQDLLNYLAAANLGFELEYERAYMGTSGLSEQHNPELAQQFSAACQSIGHRPQQIGVPYGTNASIFSAAGIPSIVFGPGNIAQAHTADEWVAIDQLEAASEIYYQFISQLW